MAYIKLPFVNFIIWCMVFLDCVMVSYLGYEAFYLSEVNIGLLNSLVVANDILVISVISHCFIANNLKSKFTLFSFVVAFFVLLLGRFNVALTDERLWGQFVFTNVSYISYLNEAKGLFYIFISLICVFIAYSLPVRFVLFSENSINSQNNIVANFMKVSRVRSFSLYIMYLGAVAAFIKIISKVLFVISYGYLSTYLVTGDAFYQNTFVDLFDKFYILGFYGFLATFPSKKEIKWPIFFYVIYSVLSLLTGIRGEIVVNSLFLVWYFMKRDELLTDEKKTITKTKIILLFVLATFGMVFLFNYGYTRVGSVASQDSFINKIANFIYSQGGSGKLIGLGLENKQIMLEYISPFRMVFYPITGFLLNNSIVRIVTGGVLGQSSSSIMLNPGFGSVLTFVTNYQSFLNGAGLGTCYIAELSVAFGLLGVIIGNLILGFLFKFIDNIKIGNWAQTTFLCNAFVILVYIPRHAMLQIIPESIALILFVILIRILSKYRLTFK